MNNYTKFHADLVNVDIAIEEEDNVLIFLNYLLDEEYETFVVTFISGKQSLSYNGVSTALVNHEVRREDNHSSSNSTTAEVMTTRGIVPIIRRAREILRSPKLMVMKI